MTDHPTAGWDLPDPFILELTVRDEDTDRIGHANNVVYVRWLEEVSWAHIESNGMTWALHEQTGKAMAITRTEIDYLAAANTGDHLLLGTWPHPLGTAVSADPAGRWQDPGAGGIDPRLRQYGKPAAEPDPERVHGGV